MSAATRSTGRRPGNGLVARVLDRFLGSADDAEAADLRADALAAGATPVADCRAGERVTVVGTVRSTTLRPRGGAPALEVELYDGTGRILLTWLGRRRIGGIEPGRSLAATGRVTAAAGGDPLVLINPSYELRPRGVRDVH